MKAFDPFQYFTREFNHIYHKFRSKITRGAAITHVREVNLQLFRDDWKNDLEQHLDRTYEEISCGLDKRKPDEIFEFAVKTKTWTEKYGHWYWDVAEEFFTEVCSSSLINYLDDKEVETAMAQLNSRLIERYNRLKEETEQITKQNEDLAKKKNEAMTEMAAISVKITNKKDELHDITTRQAALYKEINQLEKEAREKQESFHKDLKKKYDDMEAQMRKKYDSLEEEFKSRSSKAEKEFNSITKRNGIGKFIDSLFGGKNDGRK